jgi:hypothetical protein
MCRDNESCTVPLIPSEIIVNMESQLIIINANADFIPCTESDATLNVNAKTWPLLEGVLVCRPVPVRVASEFGTESCYFIHTEMTERFMFMLGSVNIVHPRIVPVSNDM